MRHLRDLLPFVRLAIPDVAEPVAIDALRQAANTWCSRVKCWRHTRQLTFNTTTPELRVAPLGTTLVAIDWAKTVGARCELDVMSYSDINTDHANQHKGHEPTHYLQDTFGMMELWPFDERSTASPDVVVDVSMYLTPLLIPDMGDAEFDAMNQIPIEIADLFGRFIADGAKGILFDYAGPTQNPAQADRYMGKFEKKIVDHSSIHLTGQQRAPIRTTSRFM